MARMAGMSGSEFLHLQNRQYGDAMGHWIAQLPRCLNDSREPPATRFGSSSVVYLKNVIFLCPV